MKGLVCPHPQHGSVTLGIVMSDIVTGFWAFRLEGFNGWNGLDWGVPNISSAQDWENGPAVQAKTRPN